MSKEPEAPQTITDDFSFDILKHLDLSKIDWEKEIKYIGALSGSVTGSFLSTQLSWSLGLRIATVLGCSYSGAILATVGYQLYKKMAEETDSQMD